MRVTTATQFCVECVSSSWFESIVLSCCQNYSTHVHAQTVTLIVSLVGLSQGYDL